MSKEKRARTYEIGECPVCKSDNIEYGGSSGDCNDLYYEVKCLDCGSNSKEWYHLEYVFTEEA